MSVFSIAKSWSPAYATAYDEPPPRVALFRRTIDNNWYPATVYLEPQDCDTLMRFLWSEFEYPLRQGHAYSPRQA